MVPHQFTTCVLITIYSTDLLIGYKKVSMGLDDMVNGSSASPAASRKAAIGFLTLLLLDAVECVFSNSQSTDNSSFETEEEEEDENTCVAWYIAKRHFLISNIFTSYLDDDEEEEDDDDDDDDDDEEDEKEALCFCSSSSSSFINRFK